MSTHRTRKWSKCDRDWFFQVNSVLSSNFYRHDQAVCRNHIHFQVIRWLWPSFFWPCAVCCWRIFTLLEEKWRCVNEKNNSALARVTKYSFLAHATWQCSSRNKGRDLWSVFNLSLIVKRVEFDVGRGKGGRDNSGLASRRNKSNCGRDWRGRVVNDSQGHLGRCDSFKRSWLIPPSKAARGHDDRFVQCCTLNDSDKAVWKTEKKVDDSLKL